MKKLCLLLTGIIVLLVSCIQPASGDVVKSQKQRIVSPDVSQTDFSELVGGNTAFATNLYQQLSTGDGNLFYSPYSISLALAMVYAGSRTETEKQMADTLHFTLPQEQLHPAFNKLDEELSKRGEGARGKDDKGFRLHIVNAIWGQKDFTFLAQFLDTLAQNYGAGLRTLDFAESPEESRRTINNWVSDATEDRIKDLIPQGAIDSLTRLVLTNAIYFNAAWQFVFEKSATQNEAFHLLNGSTVNVPMMKQLEFLNYVDSQDYQAVELPYDGRELSMLIVIPDTGRFKPVESSLDEQMLDTIITNLKSGHVSLSMPKFEFDSSFNLNDRLSKMGMPDAFSAGADFSGMTGKRDLFISQVIHKAFISVDENGTEAAAATAVVMSTTAAPAGPEVEITIDRPFTFFIRDIETGTILFMGRVLNPQ